jgi:hypothetical protein
VQRGHSILVTVEFDGKLVCLGIKEGHAELFAFLIGLLGENLALLATVFTFFV